MEKSLTSSGTKPVLTGAELSRICQNLKAIAPRSYEKTFSGMKDENVLSGLMICLSDLTQEQIITGMNHVRDMAWIPDPAMFRRWCLGQFDYSSENGSKVRDSYHGPHAALNNVIGWLESKEMGDITNAEKLAYNRTYRAFNHLKFDGSKNSIFLAHQAFKENYAEVVRELVESGQVQSVWVAPTSIENKEKPKAQETSRTFGLKRSAIQEQWIQDRAKQLQSSGMTLPMSLLQASREMETNLSNGIFCGYDQSKPL